MNKKLFILVFLVGLSHFAFSNPPPIAKKGVLDLRMWNFAQNDPIELKGEYQIYWKQLLPSSQYILNNNISPTAYYTVPGYFTDVKSGSASLQKHGYATVSLRILLPKSVRHQELAFRFPTSATSVLHIVNGDTLFMAGKVGKTKEEAIPNYQTGVREIAIGSDTLDLIMQVSNYHHYKSGIWIPLKLGLAEKLKESRKNTLLIEIFLAGCIFIMAIYHLSFYQLRRQNQSALYFGLFCLVFFFRILVTGEYQFSTFFHGYWLLSVKIAYSSMMIAGFAINSFFNHVLDKQGVKRINQAVTIIAIVCSSIILLMPSSIFTYTVYGFYVIFLLVCINVSIIIYRAFVNNTPGVSIITIGGAVLLLSVMNDTMTHANLIHTPEMFAWGTLIFIFSQAYVLSSKFARVFETTENLSVELATLNKSLESKVITRTTELERSNQSLLNLNEELSTQTENLASANKEIKAKSKKMRSSILYAKRIQDALLGDWRGIQKYFPDSFMLYKPRDIVSGDFYWFIHKNNKSILVMADCTGHGVPGAFMSVIGNEVLNDLTGRIKPEFWDTTHILEEMDAGVKAILNQKESKMPDGMDMGICIIDHKEQKIQFAGAKVPLLCFQDGETIFIKGNNRPIGGLQKQKITPFDSHTINITPDTTIYLYSDGFQDQFGGEEDRKFMSRRFRELLKNHHHKPMPFQQSVLQFELRKWQANAPQIDDILVIGVKLG